MDTLVTVSVQELVLLALTYGAILALLGALVAIAVEAKSIVRSQSREPRDCPLHHPVPEPTPTRALRRTT